MFATLETLLRFHGPGAKAVLWEHNSHLGDAAATEMSVRGELNVGHLCREKFGARAYLGGFGTDHGTVAAADEWDGPMRVMSVRYFAAVTSPSTSLACDAGVTLS
jgi:protein-L-isoaspartate(D-aspartate) O-methyltransferase